MADALSIPGYELLEKIGSGSSGAVYKARQVSMDRLVAIKILPGKLARDQRFIERFTREARAVAKLNHPNVVTGIDVGAAGEINYFVMEYVDGESAAAGVKRDGPMAEAGALEIVRQTALAMEHAHENGIIHRDIKPANILLTKSGAAKLADLGVAKQAEGDAAAGGRVFGTPYYMSPEAARGEADIDIRSDIYSLGATLYHLLAGTPPFKGDPPAVVMTKQVTEEPEDIREFNPKASKAAVELVSALMAKDRNERPATPADVVNLIERVQQGRPLGLPVGPRKSGRVQAHAAPPRRRPAKPEAPAGSKGMLLAATAIFVVLIGVGVWVMLEGAGDDSGGGPSVTTSPPGVRRPPIVNIGASAPIAPAPTAALDAQARDADRQRLAEEAFRAARGDGLSVQEKIAALEEVIRQYPDTSITEEARRLAAALKSDMEAAAAARRDAQEQAAAYRAAAEELAGTGDYTAARAALDLENAQGALAEFLTEIDADIRRQAEEKMASVERDVASLVALNRFAEARRILDGVKVEGIGTLDVRHAVALATIERAENAAKSEAEAEAASVAELAYAGLCGDVEARLREFDTEEADRMLAGRLGEARLQPVRGRIEEDRRHAKVLGELVAAAGRAVALLKGQTVPFKLRDGSTINGKINRVVGREIEMESRMGDRTGGGVVATSRVPLAKLACAEVADLGLHSMNGGSPQTFIALAILFAVDGNLDTAKKHVETARGLGADVSALERRWFGVGASDEARAAMLLTRARGRYKAGEYKEALGLLETLQKDLSNTRVYKANYGQKRTRPKGSILREFWTDIKGEDVQDLVSCGRFPRKPSGSDEIKNFDAPRTWGNEYGQRICGYVHPPVTGRYVFWIVSDDQSNLYLSTDDNPANKRTIARCTQWRPADSWDELLDGQKSNPVELTAGRRYYVEVLHKEGGGYDHVMVGWQRPDGKVERPIPGGCLSPPDQDAGGAVRAGDGEGKE